jgi:hypothetical protein
MRLLPRALLAGGLGFAVALLVACGGGDGLLGSNDASTLASQLDQVSAAVSDGHCGGAARGVAAFSQSVANLPVTVNQRLRRNLLQGASTVGVLAQRDCRTTTTPSTSSTSTATTTTSTSISTTTPTSTQTSTTSSSTTSPTSTATSSTQSSTSTTSGGAGLGGSGGGAKTGNGR